MRLARLIPRLLNRQPHHESYEYMLQSPVGKLLTWQIALAVQDRASRITFGFPPDVELTPLLKDEIESDEQQHHEQWCREYPVFATASTNDKASRADAEMEPVRFCHRSGWGNVPSWIDVDGQLHRMWGTPSHLYPYVVAQIGDRVVSLNASGENPQPVKWIEYSMNYGKSEDRQFVEVKLFVEDNSSVTIELLGARTEPHDVHVSRYTSGG